MMKRFSAFIPALLLACTISGCAMFKTPEPGISENELISMRGKPDFEQEVNGYRLLEWSGNNTSQYTYMATITPDGTMVSYEQVLTLEKFYSLKPGKSTKQDVLRTVGHPDPFETDHLALSGDDVWSYRYKESGVWDSMMHIHFDHNGVVKRLENGIDPLNLRDN